MQRARPPFRADHVGSLLRPQRVREARVRFAKGEITAAELQRIESLEIGTAVQRQKQNGLRLATDGEFRRAWWHFDFLKALDGCAIRKTEGAVVAGRVTSGESIRVTGKLDFPPDHPMLEHFKLLKDRCDLAGVMPKMTIPSPSMLHYRGGRDAVSEDAYPDIDAFFVDLAISYRKAVKAFYDAGCRYLQFDDTSWGYFCSEDQRAKLRARGEDPETLPGVYARVINYAIAERPADMTITTHVCRGNFRSTWIASGGYEPSRSCCSRAPTTTAISSNTTPIALAASNRYGFCQPATRSSCWVWSPRRPGHWRTRTTSSGALMRRRGWCRSISSRCRRNAASPRRKKATSSPRMSNGRSCASSPILRTMSGAGSSPTQCPLSTSVLTGSNSA